jgi:hypothetical protein
MIKHKISSKIIHQVKDFFYQHLTPIQAFKKAVGLPNLAIAKIKELDDIWLVVMNRAEQGGKLLARTLLKQFYSKPVDDEKSELKEKKRPVSLIGYGMGARLIYHCLEALPLEAKKLFGDSERAKGLIEHVVLIGAPVGIDIKKFQTLRSVVSNRFINCYCRYDWILALLYRSKTYEMFIAGLYPIHLPGAEPKATTAAQSTANQAKEQVKYIKKIALAEQGELSIELTDKVPEPDQSQEVVALGRDVEEPLESKKAARLAKMKEEAVVNSFTQFQLIENYDITNIVNIHADYPKVLPTIMKLINLQQ